MGAIIAVLRFEFGYHMRRASFWLIAALFGAFGCADMFSKGSAGNAFFFVNSPSQIFQTTVWYTLFSVLAVTAFIAETFVRDRRCGTEGLILATPVRKIEYLGTRFIAAFIVALLAFSAYLPGMVLGSLVPGLNTYAIGPQRIDAYLLSYVGVALPNLFIVSVFVFVLASRTRSMVASYAGAVVLVMLYIAVMLSVGVEQVDYEALERWSVLDPYAYFSLESLTLGWTVHQHNTAMPDLGGVFLLNRLLWVGIALFAWVLAYRAFPMRMATASGGRRAAADARGRASPAVRQSVVGVPAPFMGWKFLPRLLAFELKLVLKDRAFQLLCFCGVVSLFFAASGSRSFEHSNPSTDILIFTASMYFRYVLFAIVVFYAAEAMWRDRDTGIQQVIDATPLPTWLIVLSKLGALFGVVTINLLLCMAVVALYQVVHGYYEFELALSARMLFLVHGPYFYFLAVLALFFQALTRHKYAGMALVLLVMLSIIPLDAFGLFHNLYRFGATNDIGYSPMNGYGGLFEGHMWFVAYWSAFCAVLLVVTCVIWPRGAADSGIRVWRRGWTMAALPLRAALGTATLATAALAGWIVYNTAVLNPYQPPGKELLAVNHEKRFKQHEALPMPVVVATSLKVDLYPAERQFVAKGRYTLENRTSEPIREIHLSTFINLKLVDMKYPGARLAEAHPEWGYYIYRLDVPLAPGARADMDFVTRTDAPHGFLNQVDSDDVYMVAPNDVVHNGSALYSPFILPFIGYTKMVEHKEAWLRHKHGLPTLDQRMRAHDDPVGLAQALTVSHLAWSENDIVVGTSAEQTSVSSGREVRRWQQDGRNYAHFQSQAPERGKFTLYSARYDKVVDNAYHVPIEVYHHPAHSANVARMVQHLGGALTLYESTFGPYAYDWLRIAEFVYYPGMVYSEGGVIGLPEVLVWKAALDADGEDAMIGWLAYLLAHSWWEDQIVAADVAGGMVIREALSGYATNLYRRSIYTPERFQRVKQRQMRDFFRALGKVDYEEPPLADVYNEVAIARFKGQMVLELIEAQIGQPALLDAIREFLARFRGKPAPYATVLDLRDAILTRTPPDLRERVTELFGKVITYHYGLTDAGYSVQPDGSYQVRISVEAGKLYTEGLGAQRAATLDMPLDVAIFDEQGQRIAGQRIVFDGARAEAVIRTTTKPLRVLLDPDLTLPAAMSPGRERRLKTLAPQEDAGHS